MRRAVHLLQTVSKLAWGCNCLSVHEIFAIDTCLAAAAERRTTARPPPRMDLDSVEPMTRLGGDSRPPDGKSMSGKAKVMDVELGDGKAARVEVPSGWVDRSTLCFIAPPRKERLGMLIKAHQVRASYAVAWLPGDERTLDELRESHPAPKGVTRLTERTLSEAPAVLKRTYRYSDAMVGVLEQSQTLIADGERVVTVTLTADPLSFAQCQAEIESSPRTLRAAQNPSAAETADEEGCDE